MASVTEIRPLSSSARMRSAILASPNARALLLGGFAGPRCGLLRPIVGIAFRALERFFASETGRHRRVGAGKNLMMLDVERAQPALLAHRQGDEIADLDQFGLAVMLVQPIPEFIAGG